MAQCHACATGDHDNCVDHPNGFRDAIDLDPPLCDCNEGDCEEQVSYACASWLHNCPGCPCDCHQDPAARAVWREAHRRYLARLDKR